MDRDAGKGCPLEYALSRISGKWRITILKELSHGPVRYGALVRGISGISPKILIQHLREMEDDGLVARTIYPEIPPRVEYALTRAGLSVFGLLPALRHWGLSVDAGHRLECRNCEKCVPRNPGGGAPPGPAP